MSKTDDSKVSTAVDNDEVKIVDRLPTESESSLEATAEIMARGLDSITNSLFEHAVKEADRLPKVRRLLDKIEERLFEEDLLEALPPAQLVKFYELLNRASDGSLNFLERMFSLAMKISAYLEARREVESLRAAVMDPDTQKLLDSIEPEALEELRKNLLKLLSHRKK